jgi:amino acid transporter
LPEQTTLSPIKPVTAAVAAPPARKVTLLGLIAATYFMVAGGPYGLEDVIGQAGYLWAVVALLVVPFVWALPTTLMVSELASAMPEEGGYYVWVRRALGPFWGFQEAWLSLAASIFDMAIYPILFATYLGFAGRYLERAVGGHDFWVALTGTDKGLAGLVIGTAMIAGCALANLRPPRSVGRSSVLLTLVLLGPFAVLAVLAAVDDPAPTAGARSPPDPSYVGALLFAMWNFMGWDNATTFAGDVDRPQRTYPLAMAGAVTLVTVTYVIPVLAAAHTAIPRQDWATGSWVAVAERVGGPALALALGLGGMVAAFGTFNSLVLSYSRLPVVLAQDGCLPRVFTRRLRSGAPWVSVVVCAVAWALATQLGLKRVLALDVILYGLSLLLEFAALLTLRLREPGLQRPFRVPGGTAVAALLGLLPALLIGLAVFDQASDWQRPDDELLAPGWAVVLGAGLAALGPVVYFARRRLQGVVRSQ